MRDHAAEGLNSAILNRKSLIKFDFQILTGQKLSHLLLSHLHTEDSFLYVSRGGYGRRGRIGRVSFDRAWRGKVGQSGIRGGTP
jgi:hypothetical protein